VLLSLHRPATADVRGNLADAQVVTDPSVDDWLKDRWQAAKDMTGAPIPGAHWVQIDLQAVCSVQHVVLDWETALAKRFDVEIRPSADAPWRRVATQKQAKVVGRKKKQHVLHRLRVEQVAHGARFVRVALRQRATKWGMSLWRVEVWGRCESEVTEDEDGDEEEEEEEEEEDEYGEEEEEEEEDEDEMGMLRLLS